MNTQSPSILAALLLTSPTSCFLARVEGNGEITKESRQLATPAHGIHLSVPARVLVTDELSPNQVQMRGESNILDEIRLSLRSNVVHIEAPRGVWLSPTQEVTIALGLENSETMRFAVSGDGSIAGRRRLLPQHLELDISGSGTLDLEAECQAVSGDISGSGTIRIRGRCNRLDGDISGSGAIDTRKLATDTAHIDISGSGNASIRAQVHVEVDISGSGDVEVYGSPTVDSDISGSGSVVFYESE